MNLSNLKPAEGSVKTSKRVGRGQGSGKGGTSKRGTKGAQSRSGYKSKIGFEGGQMPIQRRLPKGGFKNVNRIEYKVINLSELQHYVDRYQLKDINPAILYENGIISKSSKVKVLGNGDLTAKVNIELHAISKSAQAKLEAAGGTVKLIG